MRVADAALAVEVVSDVVCPWCYLGKKRLEQALAHPSAGAIALHWRPYQLDPSIAAEGMDRKAYLSAKFGGAGQLGAIHERLQTLGAEVGIAYAFDRIERAPNTLDAHRLIRWAAENGAQDRLVARLFAIYFEEGGDIGDRALLVDTARQSGMDGEAVRRRYESGADIDAVRAEIQRAQQAGVTGVPFFIFANRFAVAGAQSAELLGQALAQARASLAG